MTELVMVEQGVALLDAETAEKIVEFELAAKRIKDAEEALKAAILTEMREKGIVKVDTGKLLINYIAGGMRETFDGKALKAERPDVYDEYCKLTPTKDCIRIKVR